MFKKVSTIAFSVLLGSLSQSTPLQAMYIPTQAEIDCYYGSQEERRVKKQEEAMSLDRIQNDDFLASLILELLENTVAVETMAGENFERKLIDALKAFVESEEMRLSVERNVLIGLCNIGLSNIDSEGFKALGNNDFKALCDSGSNTTTTTTVAPVNEQNDLLKILPVTQQYKNYLLLGVEEDEILDEIEVNKLLSVATMELLSKCSDCQTNSRLHFLCNKVLNLRDTSATAGFIFWKIILTKTSLSTLFPILKLLCKDIRPPGFEGSWGLGYEIGRSAAIEFCSMQNLQMICVGIASGTYDVLLAGLATTGISFLYSDGPTLTTICSIIGMVKLLSFKIGKFVDVEKLIKKVFSKDRIEKYGLDSLAKGLSIMSAESDLKYFIAGELLVLVPLLYCIDGLPSLI